MDQPVLVGNLHGRCPPAGQKIDLTSLNFDYTEIQPGDFLLGVCTSKTGFTAGSQLVGFFRDGNSSSTFTTRNGTSINLMGVPELQNITDAVFGHFERYGQPAAALGR